MVDEEHFLYRSLNVWSRRDEVTVAVYRCFEVLPLGKFCVQSKDFYRRPFSDAVVLQSEQQFLELLVESPPGERAGLYDSLEDAIRAHDEEFEG
jgi:hypothetical protein